MDKINSRLFSVFEEDGDSQVPQVPTWKKPRASPYVQVVSGSLAAVSADSVPVTAREADKSSLGFRQKIIVIDLDETLWRAVYMGGNPEVLTEDCAAFLRAVPSYVKTYQVAQRKLSVSMRPIIAHTRTEWKELFVKMARLQKQAQEANAASPVLLHFMTSGTWDKTWSFEILNSLYGDEGLRFGETLQATFDNRFEFSQDKALAHLRKGVLLWKRFTEEHGWQAKNPALQTEDVVLIDNDNSNNKAARTFGFRAKLMPTTPRLAQSEQSLDFSRDFPKLIAELHDELDEAAGWLDRTS